MREHLCRLISDQIRQQPSSSSSSSSQTNLHLHLHPVNIPPQENREKTGRGRLQAHIITYSSQIIASHQQAAPELAFFALRGASSGYSCDSDCWFASLPLHLPPYLHLHLRIDLHLQHHLQLHIDLHLPPHLPFRFLLSSSSSALHLHLYLPYIFISFHLHLPSSSSIFIFILLLNFLHIIPAPPHIASAGS
jgi:hypothetical protein